MIFSEVGGQVSQGDKITTVDAAIEVFNSQMNLARKNNDQAECNRLTVVLRWLDSYDQSHPSASLADAIGELVKRSKGNLSTHTKLVEQQTLQEISNLAGGGASVSVDKEDTAKSKHPELVVSTDEVIQQVLRVGIFRIHFSTQMVNEHGDSVGSSGFRTFFSPKGLLHRWPGSMPKVLEFLVPESITVADEGDVIAKTLAVNKVMDGLVIEPVYDRIDRKVTKEESYETRNFWGKKQTKTKQVTSSEFAANKPVIFPETAEEMTRVVYQTLTTEAGCDGQYTDEGTRPGNMLLLELLIPKSLAAKIAEVASIDPNFVRKLVQMLALDKENGLLSCLNQQDGLSRAHNFRDFSRLPGIKSDRGLPPYNDPVWQEASMLVDVNLEVPATDQWARTEAGQTLSEMWTKAAQKLNSRVVKAKVDDHA